MHLSNGITEVMEGAQPLPEAPGSIRLLWMAGSGAETSALYTFPSTSTGFCCCQYLWGFWRKYLSGLEMPSSCSFTV